MAEKNLGMVIDLAACIGCNACTVACKKENDVALGQFNTYIESWDAGEYPHVSRASLPRLCNHCVDAPCVAACPTEATFVTEDGTVQINLDECIGCQACIGACPYGMRWFDEEAMKVHKCSFCYHRTQYGLLPACVSTCPTHARMFGDLNDPESDVAKRVAAAQDVGVLYGELGIDTHVYYVGLSATMGAPRTSCTVKGGDRIEEDA